MGMFKNILVRAHHGDKEAVDKLYEQYKPLLRKYSFVNGVFDEDLHHILVIAFLEMIRTFKVESFPDKKDAEPHCSASFLL